MGTPVPSKSREHEYSANIKEPKIKIRQLTEEERRHYDSLGKPGKRIVAYNYQDATLFSEDKESEEMKNKPTREKLIEMCQQYPSKYRASYGISKELGVSHGTVDNWIKAYEIKDVWGKPDENIQKTGQESCIGAPDLNIRGSDEVTGQGNNKESNIEIKDEGTGGFEYLEDPNEPNELTLAAQPGDGQIIYPEEEAQEPTKGIVAKIKYSQYTLGSTYVGVHFEDEIITIASEKGLTFEEAAALVELLNDIL